MTTSMAAGTLASRSILALGDGEATLGSQTPSGANT